MQHRRDAAGFTLVELLVIIAILGVLGGVAVFSLSGINDNSQRTSCLTEATNLKTAVEVFRQQVGFYPTNNAMIGPYMVVPASLVSFTSAGTATSSPTYSWSSTKCSAITPAITP